MSECRSVPEIAKRLRVVSRPPSEREQSVVMRVKERRPDLKPYLNRIPIRVVKDGKLQALTGFIGWHHWEERPEPHSIEVFMDEPSMTEELIKHEYCHAKLLDENPDAYRHLDERMKEGLTEACRTEV